MFLPLRMFERSIELGVDGIESKQPMAWQDIAQLIKIDFQIA